MRWFRVYSDIIDDPKIYPLSDAQKWLFIALCCLASKNQSADGQTGYTSASLARRLSGESRTLDRRLAGLVSQNLVTITSQGVRVENWQKWQMKSDSVAERVARHRAKCNVTNPLHETLHVTGQDVDVDKSKNKPPIAPHDQEKIAAPSKPLQSPFKAPSPDEVEEYGKSIDYHIDGEHFCDHYASRGWMIGKNKMKDWRAAVRTWKRNDQKRGESRPGQDEEPNPCYYEYLEPDKP